MLVAGQLAALFFPKANRINRCKHQMRCSSRRFEDLSTVGDVDCHIFKNPQHDSRCLQGPARIDAGWKSSDCPHHLIETCQ